MAKVYDVNTSRVPRRQSGDSGARARILAAARRLLRSRGVAGVTTRQVGRMVGLTPMAMYRHFRDKDGLFQALADEGFAEFEIRLAAAVAGVSRRQCLVNVVRAYRDFALERPREFELMFFTRRGTVPRAPDSLRTTPSPSFAVLIAAVTDGMQAGELLPADPAQTILLIWSAALGLIALHMTGRFGFDDDVFRRQYDATLHLLLARLAPDPGLSGDSSL